MVGVWEYTDLEELQDSLSNAIDTARQRVSIQAEDDDITNLARALDLDSLIVADEWGDGTATIQETELRIIAFFSVDESRERLPELPQEPLMVNDIFVSTVEQIVTDARGILIDDESRRSLPDTFYNIFLGLELQANSTDNLDNQVNRLLGSSVRNSVFDLTALELVSFAEPTNEEEGETDVFQTGEQAVSEFEDLPRVSLEQLREEEVIETEEVREEPEEEELPEFPEVEKPLRDFAVSEDELEIPAGKHEMKIDARDPYVFEEEMVSIGVEIEDISGEILQEIGNSIAAGDFGKGDPPGSFPRTGIYIRNRLKFEDITYIYQLYKDLVYYSGYISGTFRSMVSSGFRTGTYRSFREYIYVLKKIGEEDGTPTPIETLSQQAVAARGLSVVPEHPTIEGETAPWLENRQYIDVVDADAIDVWENAYKFYHEDEEEVEA